MRFWISLMMIAAWSSPALAACVGADQSNLAGLSLSDWIESLSRVATPSASSADSANHLVEILDRLASARELSKIGAQWLILKKSKWIIEKDETTGSGGYRLQTSENPYSAIAAHRLFLPKERLSEAEIAKTLEWLEKSVFPILLKGIQIGAGSITTRQSLEASMNSAVAMEATHDTLRFEGSLSSRQGRIRQALSSSARGFSQAEFQSLSSTLLASGRDQEKLYSVYSGLKPCHTSCLEYMESKVIRGFLLDLENGEFAASVHGRENPFYGCIDEGAHFKKLGRSNLDKVAQYGAGALIGRPLYFLGLDSDRLDAVEYQGMNGVIRSISQAAAEDLARMGGLGGNPSKSIDAGDPASIDASGLKGVSEQITNYWKRRKELEARYTPEQAMAMARREFLDRPFFLETVFEPILGKTNPTMADWVENLYRVNPRTPYQIYAYQFFTPEYYQNILSAIDERPSVTEMSRERLRESMQVQAEPYSDRDGTYRYTLDEVVHNVKDWF